MRNGFVAAVVAFSVAGTGVALGQAAAAAGPTFEVASVRPAAPMEQSAVIAILRTGRLPQEMHIETDRATFKYMPLKQLIGYAYKVRTYQVSGPEWTTTDRFDVQAKLPDGASKDDVPAMMKALLNDRFKLTAHLETKDHPVLGLMLAKGGSKMKEVPAGVALDDTAELKPGETRTDSVDGPMVLGHNPDGSAAYNMGARGIMTLRLNNQDGTMELDGVAMSMKGLAVMLTSLGGGSGRQVVDMTGLTGHYDVKVIFGLQELTASLRDSGVDIPGGAGSNEPTGNSTVADALNSLGLKMTGTHAPVEQLVIDHVEKLPTEN